MPLLLFLLPWAQTPVMPDPVLSEVRQLIHENEFTRAEARAREAITRNSNDADASYLLGFALAKQERWSEAQELLERVIALDPQYVQAYVELAGIAFRLSLYQAAIHRIREALEQQPDDAYSLNFLATVLYLEGNQIEALHHWNKVDAPRINHIAFQTGKRFETELLERLFKFNDGEVLLKSEILEARWKQERLDLGPLLQTNLMPASDNLWNVDVILPPRSTLTLTQELLLRNGLRAPLYEELTLSYPQELGSGRQVTAAVRWDSKKKRIAASAQFPFLSPGSDGLRLEADLREENWRHASSLTRYIQQTETFTGEYEILFTGRKSLKLGGGYEHHFMRFATESSAIGYSPHLIRASIEWNQRLGLNDADTVQMDIRGRYDSFFGRKAGGARQGSAAVRLPWLIDNRNALELSLNAGLSENSLPLNHYFILGVGPDHPLPLRAHPIVEDGYKGNGPMARDYVLLNIEFRRHLFDAKYIGVSGLAFTDVARVWGTPFGARNTERYHDAGVGIRIGVFGRDLLDVRLGVDMKTSSFNMWVGLPD